MRVTLEASGGSSPSGTAAELNASTKALKQTITRESENFVARGAYTRCSRKHKITRESENLVARGAYTLLEESTKSNRGAVSRDVRE